MDPLLATRNILAPRPSMQDRTAKDKVISRCGERRYIPRLAVAAASASGAASARAVQLQKQILAASVGTCRGDCLVFVLAESKAGLAR